MSKYTHSELKEMATIVMDSRGTPEYVALTDILSFYTQLPLAEVVRRIEEMADA